MPDSNQHQHFLNHGEHGEHGEFHGGVFSLREVLRELRVLRGWRFTHKVMGLLKKLLNLVALGIYQAQIKIPDESADSQVFLILIYTRYRAVSSLDSAELVAGRGMLPALGAQ